MKGETFKSCWTTHPCHLGVVSHTNISSDHLSIGGLERKDIDMIRRSLLWRGDEKVKNNIFPKENLQVLKFRTLL